MLRPPWRSLQRAFQATRRATAGLSTSGAVAAVCTNTHGAQCRTPPGPADSMPSSASVPSGQSHPSRQRKEQSGERRPALCGSSQLEIHSQVAHPDGRGDSGQRRHELTFADLRPSLGRHALVSVRRVPDPIRGVDTVPPTVRRVVFRAGREPARRIPRHVRAAARLSPRRAFQPTAGGGLRSRREPPPALDTCAEIARPGKRSECRHRT